MIWTARLRCRFFQLSVQFCYQSISENDVSKKISTLVETVGAMNNLLFNDDTMLLKSKSGQNTGQSWKRYVKRANRAAINTLPKSYKIYNR